MVVQPVQQPVLEHIARPPQRALCAPIRVHFGVCHSHGRLHTIEEALDHAGGHVRLRGEVQLGELRREGIRRHQQSHLPNDGLRGAIVARRAGRKLLERRRVKRARTRVPAAVALVGMGERRRRAVGRGGAPRAWRRRGRGGRRAALDQVVRQRRHARERVA